MTDQSDVEKTVIPPTAVPTARCDESGEKASVEAGEVRTSVSAFKWLRVLSESL